MSAVVVIAAMIGGGVWWWMAAREDKCPPDVEKPAKPKVARAEPRPPSRRDGSTPSQPTVTNVPTAKPMRPKPETYRDESGIERYMNGARVPDPNRPRREPIKVVREPPLFHNWAENQIAAALTIAPGKMLFGTRRFDERFLQSFKKSLNEKIEILDTDTEEQKVVKKAVMDTKAELKEAMDRGEDICKIMQDSFDELQRLAHYKRDMEKTLRQVASDKEITVDEFNRVIEEANKMLADKGIAPLKGNMIVRRNMRLAVAREGDKAHNDGRDKVQ